MVETCPASCLCHQKEGLAIHSFPPCQYYHPALEVDGFRPAESATSNTEMPQTTLILTRSGFCFHEQLNPVGAHTFTDIQGYKNWNLCIQRSKAQELLLKVSLRNENHTTSRACPLDEL